MAAGNLGNNKSAGLDGIPGEIFKYAPRTIYAWLARFFNSCIMHSFVPSKMTDVLLIPILKGGQKDPAESKNFRPIAIAPSSSKIFEVVLLNRLEDSNALRTSDTQFGFKKHNSTETCLFAMKEVINYYRRLNSNVFACFIDAKGAFDRVNYLELFRKLLQRGAPKYLISTLLHWYTNQKLLSSGEVSFRKGLQ